MKKILILTADRTGNGHQAASNALDRELSKLNYDVMQYDCFKAMGALGKSLEDSYIPMTIHSPIIYYMGYVISQTLPNFVHFLIYTFSHRKFEKIINEYNPDIIINVHSMFTKTISKIIKKKNINTLYYLDVVDLIDPPNVWFDKNADVIFVPTEKIKEDYIKKGFPNKDNIILSGMPIRSDIIKRTTPKKVEGNVNILLVNPSVNLKKNIKFAKEVSKLSNVTINFICGRDEELYKALIKKQQAGKISSNVKIHGFVTNMNEFLENTHILLTKAGPNMILEGVRSSSAVVITGHILGQENTNYKYVTENDFGFKCENPNLIYEKLNDFINSGKLQKCLNNVINTKCDDGTKIVVNYINNYYKNSK